MSKRNKHTKRGVNNLDGKRMISAGDFDRLFDKGSDEIDQFIDWSDVQLKPAPRKKPVTLRLDADMLDWFKSLGRGYQTRMNAVLRSYKRSAQKA